MSYSAYQTKVIFLIYYDLKLDLKQHWSHTTFINLFISYWSRDY